MDSSNLTSEQIAQMLKLVPTPEEITLILEYPTYEKHNLGKPELYLFLLILSTIFVTFSIYMLEIIKVPNFAAKLECWFFCSTFDNKATDLKLVFISIFTFSIQKKTILI